MFFDGYLKQLPEYERLSEDVRSGRLPVAVSGLSGFNRAHVISTLCSDTGRGALVITGDEAEASRTVTDLCQMGHRAVLLPARDLCLRSGEVFSREYEQKRLFAVSAAAEKRADVVVCPVTAAVQYLPMRESIAASSVTLTVGGRFDAEKLTEILSLGGYVRCDLVEGPGQFARRGGIIDLFPTGAESPYRIDFFGDEVDSITCFDPITQRSEAACSLITVTPARELPAGAAELLLRLSDFCENDRRMKKAGETLRRTAEADLDGLSAGITPSAADRWLFLMKDKMGSVFDLLDDPLTFVCDTGRVRERLRGFFENADEDFTRLFEEGCVAVGREEYYLTASELSAALREGGAVMLDSLLYSSYDPKPMDLLSFIARQTSPFTGTSGMLAEDLKDRVQNGWAAVVTVSSMKTARACAEDLEASGVRADALENPSKAVPGRVTVTPLALSAGCEYPASRFLLTPFGRVTGPIKRKRKNTASFGSLDELREGDYIVHSVHGIGIFDGIVRRDMQGVVKDYIKIKYAGHDVLYVPVTQLDLVSKYIGGSSDEVKVKINKMGSPEWQKTRTRVRGAVKDMADELVALYAKRMQAKGHAFAPDGDMQRDFEARFDYDETDDQLRCCDEIKSDMERQSPMDRLLCGDVGFGKTEVALRAAFKAVADNKQVAILVPTTILAWQHYTTMTSRMSAFPLRVELLSRFRSASEQAAVIKGLKSGSVDIVVGTHRLISSDVAFKDLGLVVIDEEQRFGVAHKEKLKELYPNVDVLTLSATPIPRTLNMAMSGIRDMSVIEEAPGDRLPVQTCVMEENRGVILEAIRRELRRGGQVYYLHNRVDTITRCAARLAEDLPEARVSVAHGRMGEEELSREWKKLLDGETDILVCTTIIETGVDVPNANTLIIEDADRMGLSQLHQLRGRVGRSPRRAYAYFLFRRGKEINEVARRRLDAIRDFTEFGSGFRIALRDLEIRGAGSLLGARQHGQMESVGYDMYLRLLSDAVSEAKGEEIPENKECVIDFNEDAHIPESYIPSLDQRLEIYRRIADLRDNAAEEDLREELLDRFGKPPKGVEGLIGIARLRNLAATLGVYEIQQRGDWMYFYAFGISVEQVGALYKKYRRGFGTGGGEKQFFRVRMRAGVTPAECIAEVLGIL